MKKIFTILIILAFPVFSIQLRAQMRNINPNPNGDPWIVGGIAASSFGVQDTTPVLQLTSGSQSTLLPYMVDNSKRPYMRSIFLQQGMSCVHASSVGYAFTYEMNRIKNVHFSPSDSTTYYPYRFTYNFSNRGSDTTGSSFWWEGVQLIRQNGCPDYKIYGDDTSSTKWMSGIDKYNKAQKNRVDKLNTIKIDTSGSNLNVLKHWLNDHGTGDSTGGLALLTVAFNPTWDGVIPSGTPEAGKHILLRWGDSFDHQVTIVGYNDSIRYDFNNDGHYTNNVDINGDGKVNMLDWEIGAFKLANSWGKSFEDGGYIYLPYKLFADNYTFQNTVGVITVKSIDKPDMVINTKLSHPCREDIRLGVSIAGNSCITTYNTPKYFDAFDYNGGCYPMQGKYRSDSIDISLDYSYMYPSTPFGKVFFIVSDSSYTNGALSELSLVDNRWGETFTLTKDLNVDTTLRALIHGENVFSFDYYLMPTSLTWPDTYACNRICRRNPVVSNNATLTIENGVKIDFYNSNLTLQAGTSLVIGNNVTFTANAGNDTIFINGNVQIGQNVNFNAVNGGKLYVCINNNTSNNVAKNCVFQNTNVSAKYLGLKFTGCTFTNSGLNYSYGNINIDSSEFNNSYARITNGSTTTNAAYVNYCNFHNYTGNPLYIDNYQIYQIENSTVTNNGGDGIDIYNSGFNLTGANLVSGNTITYNGTNSIITPGCGIRVYHSYADIHNNIEISHTPYGIESLNNSQVSIKGNANARYCHETQQIKDNNTNQVYATVNSFPYYFQRNAIIDEDNTTPLVYYNSALVMTPLNVQNNYWGSNFTPSTDLYPSGVYTYLPIWTLLPGKKDVDVAEQEYNTANQKIEQGDYAGAKSILKQMPVDYSSSIYAQAAMKRLFELESLAGNDYAGLKTYYQTIYQNQDSTSLPKLADFLGNFCNIKSQNWPAAINWFEDKIANPESLEDSVFSIIDLGYTYFLMENSGLKSGYTGMHPEYKFTSINDFEVNRDSLIALLFKTHTNGNNKLNDGTIADQSKVILMQNTPNPFTKSTVINYKLMEAAMVKITVYNQLGKSERVIENAYKDKGVYQTEFNANGLSSGIYYYTIEINGKPCASKKMSILK